VKAVSDTVVKHSLAYLSM